MRSAGVSEPQKIRPEFRFGQNDKFRLEPAQVRTDGEGEIHRKIKHVFRPKTLAGEVMTGIRSRGYDDPILGEGLAHSGNQAGDG